MPSTYSPNLAIELIGTGDQAGSWGTSTNTNLGTLIEQAISGYVTQAITDGADTVITIPNGATGVARNMFIECTGTLSAARNLVVPAKRKLYFIYNNTTGGFAVTVKVAGLTGVSVPNGKKIALVCNGTDVFVATNYMAGQLDGSVTSETTVPTQPPGTSTGQLASTEFVQAALQAMYPVGSIYTNATNSTNPGTLFGFGTWTAFGAGRVPVGFDAVNSLFNAGEKTGGNYDGSLLAHTHGFSGTTAGGGAHTHTLNVNAVFRSSDCCSYYFPQANGNANSTQLSAISSVGDHTHSYSGNTESSGGAGTNTNVQPFITVYMWKRTV